MQNIPEIKLDKTNFVRLMDGETKTAKFRLDAEYWIVKFDQDRQGNQVGWQLASELVGYRIAKLLGVRVPKFALANIQEKILIDGGRVIQPGRWTATEFIKEATPLYLKNDKPLDPFWGEEDYLKIAAAMRVADTWVMNFDRRKLGHVLATGDKHNPEIWFIDFDNAFIVEERDSQGREWHWLDPGCLIQYLDNPKVLGGFSGTGRPINCEQLQRAKHFEEPLRLMREVAKTDLEKILFEVPAEWKINKEARNRWVDYLLYRRDIVTKTFRSHPDYSK